MSKQTFVLIRNHVSGGSKGEGVRDAPPPPGGPNSFNFMQFFGKIWQNRMLVPPGELAPPPRGNPGSATACSSILHRNHYFHFDFIFGFKFKIKFFRKPTFGTFVRV